MVPLLRQRLTVLKKNDRTTRLAVTAKMKKQTTLDKYKNTDHVIRMNSLSRRLSNHNKVLTRTMKRLNTLTKVMLVIIEKYNTHQ